MSIGTVCYVVAAILFILAAVPYDTRGFGLGWLAAAFLSAGHVLGG